MNKLQLTFAIIKPHAVKNPFAMEQIRQHILDHKFQIVKNKQIQFNNQLAEQFYDEHKFKFFYQRLHTFMCSGPLQALILARHNAIAEWRELMGPTKVFKTIYSHPDSIRGQFGLSDTRNACHGSDTPESVEREINIIFPEFNIQNWYTEQNA